MMKVHNRRCINVLSRRSMRASKARNMIAVLAIALTTLLFTALFTIAASINYSFQQENFRMAGGDEHGTLKDISLERYEEMKNDPMVKESSMRIMLGMISDPPFNKSHVEVSYLNETGMKHYFCAPEHGSAPKEGTDEVATDTHILELLGIEPKVGAKIELPIYINDDTPKCELVRRTFTLSGWWEYDSAVAANHVVLPRSAVEDIINEYGAAPSSHTGKITMGIMFKNSLSIRENIEELLSKHGYQSDDPTRDDYISIGVNWGYSGAQVSNNMDPTTLVFVAVILILIIFTGYLIIYNVFQISVTNDIKFYGLLKTVGTTGRQLKRLVRRQALILSVLGIPLGLALGFVTGNFLTPVIMEQLSYKRAFVSFNPLVFIGAALFAIITVLISCSKPGRMAAKVSPVEAVRYTESSGGKKKQKRGTNGAKLYAMAWANLGRSKKKTSVTVISLSLAVVLMLLVNTFTSGFDMEKYTRGIVADFTVGHADYFNAGRGFNYPEQAVPDKLMGEINSLDGITEAGRIYMPFGVESETREEFLRGSYSRLNSADVVEMVLNSVERLGDGTPMHGATILGMEDVPLSKLELIEGDLEALKDPEKHAIAAVYATGDYDEMLGTSHWAKLGDKVTLRYVKSRKYVYSETGEVIPPDELESVLDGVKNVGYKVLADEYEDVEYTVSAIVTVPSNLGCRYKIIGSSEFVLGAEALLRYSPDAPVMSYIFDTTDEAEPKMEEFLAEATGERYIDMDYESRASYSAEFESFKGMFTTVGGVMTSVVGLVGVLNFINAVLTGVISRRRELAMMQSIGMTGRQLKLMLVFEGLYYTVLSMLVAVALNVLLIPVMTNVFESVFWFFSYKFSLTPMLIVLPVFVLFGILTPLAVHRFAARASIVERLRENE